MSEAVRVTRGVWRQPEQVDDLRGRAAALLTAAPEDAVLSGLTAAHLHRLWIPPAEGDPIDVILRPLRGEPSDQPGSRRTEMRARRRSLSADDVTVADGLPVTSVARTWIDCAETLSLPDLVALGDSAVRGGTSAADLLEATRQARRRRGVVRARVALDLLDARSASRPESHLRVALVQRNLPKPAVNEPIFARGEWLGIPDLSYDDVRLALEYDGAVHADARRMPRDITREVDIGYRGGWQTVTFGPAEVFSRADETAAYVRALRRSRARLFR